MKSLSVLSALSLLGLAASQFPDPGVQVLTAGPYKRAPAFPASNVHIIPSASGSGQIVIGNTDTWGFPVSYPTWPTGRVISPQYPGGALALEEAENGPEGLYELVWQEGGYGGDAEGSIFVGTGCNCGGNCGGFCLLPAVGAGTWVIELAGNGETGVEGEWKVGWWNATGVPGGWQGAYIWRSTWAAPESTAKV